MRKPWRTRLSAKLGIVLRSWVRRIRLFEAAQSRMMEFRYANQPDILNTDEVQGRVLLFQSREETAVKVFIS